MTFRDDHDAALARASALERELAEAREAAAEKDARLADAEREQARLARELEQARETPAAEPVEKPATKKRTRRDHNGNEERAWWWIRPRDRSWIYYVIVALLIGFFAVKTYLDFKRAHPPPGSSHSR